MLWMVPDSPTYLEGKVLLLCDGNSRVGSEETAVGARGHLWREESTRGGRGGVDGTEPTKWALLWVWVAARLRVGTAAPPGRCLERVGPNVLCPMCIGLWVNGPTVPPDIVARCKGGATAESSATSTQHSSHVYTTVHGVLDLSTPVSNMAIHTVANRGTAATWAHSAVAGGSSKWVLHWETTEHVRYLIIDVVWDAGCGSCSNRWLGHRRSGGSNEAWELLTRWTTVHAIHHTICLNKAVNRCLKSRWVLQTYASTANNAIGPVYPVRLWPKFETTKIVHFQCSSRTMQGRETSVLAREVGESTDICGSGRQWLCMLESKFPSSHGSWSGRNIRGRGAKARMCVDIGLFLWKQRATGSDVTELYICNNTQYQLAKIQHCTEADSTDQRTAPRQEWHC